MAGSHNFKFPESTRVERCGADEKASKFRNTKASCFVCINLLRKASQLANIKNATILFVCPSRFCLSNRNFADKMEIMEEQTKSIMLVLILANRNF